MRTVYPGPKPLTGGPDRELAAEEGASSARGCGAGSLGGGASVVRRHRRRRPRVRRGALDGVAEPVLVGDDPLGGDPAVDRHDRRVPATAAQGVEEVVEPRLDAHLDIRQVGGDTLDEADGEVALLADGVRDVEEELPAGHGIHGHDGRCPASFR